MTQKQKEELIIKFLSTSKGKAKLGEALAAPLRHALSSPGYARSFMTVEPMLTEEEELEQRIANRSW